MFLCTFSQENDVTVALFAVGDDSNPTISGHGLSEMRL